MLNLKLLLFYILILCCLDDISGLYDHVMKEKREYHIICSLVKE